MWGNLLGCFQRCLSERHNNMLLLLKSLNGIWENPKAHSLYTQHLWIGAVGSTCKTSGSTANSQMLRMDHFDNSSNVDVYFGLPWLIYSSCPTPGPGLNISAHAWNAYSFERAGSVSAQADECELSNRKHAVWALCMLLFAC